MSNLIGLLTAVRGTAVPMTVTGVFSEGEGTRVECVYNAKGELKHFSALEEAFIGFGDTLTFMDGSFIEAYFTAVTDDDDDEDEEEEDEDEDEDEDDDDEDEDVRKPADHDALKN